MRQPCSAERFDLGGGHEGLVPGSHGGGEPSPLRTHALDQPAGDVPAKGFHSHLKAKPPGQAGAIRREGPGAAQGVAYAPNPIEEGVLGEVVGPGGAGRRGRIQESGDGKAGPGRGRRHLAPEGETQANRGLARGKAGDGNRGQEHPSAALPRARHIQDPGLDLPDLAAVRHDRSPHLARPAAGDAKPGQQAGEKDEPRDRAGRPAALRATRRMTPATQRLAIATPETGSRGSAK